MLSAFINLICPSMKPTCSPFSGHSPYVNALDASVRNSSIHLVWIVIFVYKSPSAVQKNMDHNSDEKLKGAIIKELDEIRALLKNLKPAEGLPVKRRVLVLF